LAGYSEIIWSCGEENVVRSAGVGVAVTLAGAGKSTSVAELNAVGLGGAGGKAT